MDENEKAWHWMDRWIGRDSLRERYMDGLDGWVGLEGWDRQIEMDGWIRWKDRTDGLDWKAGMEGWHWTAFNKLGGWIGWTGWRNRWREGEIMDRMDR